MPVATNAAMLVIINNLSKLKCIRKSSLFYIKILKDSLRWFRHVYKHKLCFLFTYLCVIITTHATRFKKTNYLIILFFSPLFHRPAHFFIQQYMSIWVNKNSPYQNKFTEIEKPVLDENRNKIVTFDKIFHKKPESESGIFGYLRDRGYELIGQIGRGGYGAVYKARSLNDASKHYAIKINYDIVGRSTLFLEVAFFHLIRKRSNLPKIVDFFFLKNSPHMVLQYFQHHQYIDIFESTKTLSQLKHYMIELMKGLNTLKSMGIFHRDIKPQNFLYNKIKKRGIIADFGLAEIDSGFLTMYIEKRFLSYQKKIPPSERKSNKKYLELKQEYDLYKKIQSANQENGVGKLGTQSYCCLETIFHFQDQGHECEMWSAGVIFMQFLSQKYHFFNQVKINKTNPVKYAAIFVMQLAHLFGADLVKDCIQKMGWKIQFPCQMPSKINIRQIIRLKSGDKNQNQMAADLLVKMLEIRHKQRITVQEAIWHPFFDEVRQEHFESYTEKKWYKKQIKRRSGVVETSDKQQNPSIQDPGLAKSSSLHNASSQFEKSVSKTKKVQEIKQSNSKLKKEKKKNRRQYFENQQEQQLQKNEFQNIQKKRTNNDQIQEEYKVKEELNERDIYETIRKYIPVERPIQKKPNRIDINMEQEYVPKKSKVKRNTKQLSMQPEINLKLNNEKEQEDERINKQAKYISPLIDESLRKIIREEEQRLKKQTFSSFQYNKEPLVEEHHQSNNQNAIVYQPSSSSFSYQRRLRRENIQIKKFDESSVKNLNEKHYSDHYYDDQD